MWLVELDLFVRKINISSRQILMTLKTSSERLNGWQVEPATTHDVLECKCLTEFKEKFIWM